MLYPVTMVDLFIQLRKHMVTILFKNLYLNLFEFYFSEICYNRIIENRDFFLNEERTRRVNEKFRTGKTKVQDDMYGLDGSFKKLAFD